VKGPEVRDDTETGLAMSDGSFDRAGVLLERDHSLATLAELMAGVRATGTGRLVLVGGEAGVGKTTLLRRFCESQDARVLWGGCEPLRTPRPLGPLWDIGEAGAGDLDDLVAAGARPGEIAMALLRELRTRAPTILVLEDLQWADEATLDVASLLATRIGAAPALVLGSYRDDELDRAQQLQVLLGELVRRPGRLSLAPL
jgi:predicted ATPase